MQSMIPSGKTRVLPTPYEKNMCCSYLGVIFESLRFENNTHGYAFDPVIRLASRL